MDRLANKAGRRGTLSAGLVGLDALAGRLGEGIGIPRDVLLALVLPGALVEHDLLQGSPDSVASSRSTAARRSGAWRA